MKRFVLLLAVFLAAFAVCGDDLCVEDVRTLGMLYEIRDMTLSPARSSWDVSQRVDQVIDELREPLAGGGYRWVLMVRPDSGGPVQKDGHLVRAAREAGDLDSFESAASMVYAVRVVVPRKKSLFRANEKVWIDSVSLRIRAEGDESSRTERIGKWMSPDTSRTFDLGLIADRVDVVAEVATRAATKGEALVELHFLQAVPRDDPDGPHYEAIQTLGRIRNSADPVTLDLEIGRLEQRLFPGAQPIPMTLLLTRLREYDRLSRSEEPEDQEKAGKLFAEIIASVRR